MSEAERAAIAAAIAVLPPMSTTQADQVCEVIMSARGRWRRADNTTDP